MWLDYVSVLRVRYSSHSTFCYSMCCQLVFAVCVSVFFFFKQKTAYEMRISDWSSDVCSSDRVEPSPALDREDDASEVAEIVERVPFQHDEIGELAGFHRPHLARLADGHGADQGGGADHLERRHAGPGREQLQFLVERAVGGLARCHPRSEEHTSELQSLMRISYAVFCLNKKKYKK